MQLARSEEFRTSEGRASQTDQLQQIRIDAIVAIGGDGTFTGQLKMSERTRHQVRSVCPGPSTMTGRNRPDDRSRLSATNTPWRRSTRSGIPHLHVIVLFFIEVVGRDTGFIALRCALPPEPSTCRSPESSRPLKS